MRLYRQEKMVSCFRRNDRNGARSAKKWLATAGLAITPMLISEYENTQNEPISPRREKAVRQRRLTARRSSFGLLAHRLGTLVEHVVHQVDQIGNLATPLRLPRSPFEATCGRRPRNDDCCVFQQPAKLPSLARPGSNQAACAPGNAARQMLRSDSGHSPVRPRR